MKTTLNGDAKTARQCELAMAGLSTRARTDPHARTQIENIRNALALWNNASPAIALSDALIKCNVDMSRLS